MNEVTLKIKTVLDSKGLQQAVKEIDGVKSATQQAGAVAQKSNGLFSNFYGSLLRIAKLRLLRGIIRAITQAFKEGTENIYYYSQALGSADASHFATTMNELASSFLYLKNSIGAVVAPLLSALLPALQTIVSWVALALDYLAQFFAVINGQSSYTKAKKQATVWKDVGKSASGAAAAAKEYKNTIMSFDEIHALNDTPSSGGGGGGGASAPDYSDMFEEVELPDNIFTKLASLFAEDGVLGKGIKHVSDALSFAIEGISPALSLLWGVLTGDIDMCREAWENLQDAISKNDTVQWAMGKGMEVYLFLSNLVDDFKLLFWNSIGDIVSFLSPVLEALGIDVGKITTKIDEQKKKITDHKKETEDAVEWFKLWMTGMDESEAATIVSLERAGKEATNIAQNAIKECTNEKKAVDDVKTSADYAGGAWSAYAREVAKAQQKTFTGSNVTGGLSNIVDWVDKVLLKFTSLNEKLGLTGLNFNNAKSYVGGAVNGLYANGGFVQTYANGGIIPRFDGGGINTAQLFIANENGSAELIGSIGNRTAVANQGQMVEAMAQGVYMAMSDVMSNNNSNTEVNVYMNDEVVARAADRGQRSLNRRFNVSLA